MGAKLPEIQVDRPEGCQAGVSVDRTYGERHYVLPYSTRTSARQVETTVQISCGDVALNASIPGEERGPTTGSPDLWHDTSETEASLASLADFACGGLAAICDRPCPNRLPAP